MKKLKLIAFAGLLAFTACSPKVEKKVMIIAKGDIEAEGANVTVKGSGSSDKTIELADETALQVTSSSGKTTINVPAEPGIYILNLRSDTLVGSQQIIGSDLSSGRVISQEELKVKIDSLNQLLTGANISESNRNYIILPNTIKKISSNSNAKIYGPFTKIPGSVEADENGKAPEMYKFYTNNEMRELIANLKKMTF